MVVLAGVLAVVYRAGQSATPDSCTYVNAAAHIAHGHGYVTSALDVHGRFGSVALFPPLLPLLIAALSRLGFDRDGALFLLLASAYVLYGLASDRIAVSGPLDDCN